MSCLPIRPPGVSPGPLGSAGDCSLRLPVVLIARKLSFQRHKQRQARREPGRPRGEDCGPQGRWGCRAPAPGSLPDPSLPSLAQERLSHAPLPRAGRSGDRRPGPGPSTLTGLIRGCRTCLILGPTRSRTSASCRAVGTSHPPSLTSQMGPRVQGSGAQCVPRGG